MVIRRNRCVESATIQTLVLFSTTLFSSLARLKPSSQPFFVRLSAVSFLLLLSVSVSTFFFLGLLAALWTVSYVGFWLFLKTNVSVHVP
jgi:hypothetical protein